MTSVQCDHARNEQGEITPIWEARSGEQYRCIDCGYPMVAKALAGGSKREKHFAHKATEGMRPCSFSNESYRHYIAKQLLVAQLWVMVPAVYPRVPPGFQGKMPLLAPARQVKAASATQEQNIYVDEQGEIRSERRVAGVEFDDFGGRRVPLARPDVVFFNAAGQPILLIEIHAEHQCSEQKIARLALYGVDTIEIHIPRSSDSAHIEYLLTVTQNTIWLYNGQQASFVLATAGTALLTGSGVAAADLEEYLSGRTETLKCRLNRVTDAIHALRAVLGRVDVEQQNARYREHAQRGQEYISRLEKERAARNERLGEDVRQQVEERRRELVDLHRAITRRRNEVAARQHTFSTEEKRLAATIANGKKQIARVLAYLGERAKRISRDLHREHRNFEMEVDQREYDLRQLREREVARQRVGLDREERELEHLAAKLDAEERELAAEAAGLGTAEETTGRAYRRRISDLAETQRRVILFERYYQELQGVKSATGATGSSNG